MKLLGLFNSRLEGNCQTSGLFHAQSREEKVEIIEMMFSLEILLNCPDGWYDANQISDRAAYAQQLQEAVDGTLEQVSKKSDCIFDQNVS